MVTPTMANNVEIGLSEKNREGVVEILSTTLADLFVLRTKLRKYHWNVRGTLFHALHEMFEEQYDELAETIDDTAERIRTYGAMAPGTLQEFSEMTRLSEAPGEYPDAEAMVRDLIEDHETIIRNLREDIETCAERYKDVGSEDFLTGLLQDHQEQAWMLRAFIER